MPIASTSSVSKHFSSIDDLESAINACNDVFEQDFGPGHVWDARCAPEIILMAKNETGTVIGVMGLHFHEKNRAWELGTMSTSTPRAHNEVTKYLLENEAPHSIRRFYGEGDAWLVMRLKQTNVRLQTSMQSIGFNLPQHFMVGIMEDDGYVPFDPVDEVLMKKKIVFAVDP